MLWTPGVRFHNWVESQDLSTWSQPYPFLLDRHSPRQVSQGQSHQGYLVTGGDIAEDKEEDDEQTYQYYNRWSSYCWIWYDFFPWQIDSISSWRWRYAGVPSWWEEPGILWTDLPQFNSKKATEIQQPNLLLPGIHNLWWPCFVTKHQEKDKLPPSPKAQRVIWAQAAWIDTNSVILIPSQVERKNKNIQIGQGTALETLKKECQQCIRPKSVQTIH